MFKAIKRLLRIPDYKKTVVISEQDMAATYDAISTVARAVDLIINSAAKIPFITVKNEKYFYTYSDKTPIFMKLLDNPGMDLMQFKKEIYRMLLFKGSCLIYNTRTALQIIPTFDVSGDYFIVGDYKLPKSDCIFISLLSDDYSMTATPYLARISKEMELINFMLKFQTTYFKNNGIPGVVLSANRPLTQKIKNRMVEDYMSMLSIMQGRTGRPYVLDDGITLKELQHSFKELQFTEAISGLSDRICANLGVPPVLINSGNNANISPNVQLFYHTTISDFTEAVCSALTYHAQLNYADFKNLKIISDFGDVPLLQTNYTAELNTYKSLYTVGLISKNEARRLARFPAVPDGDEFLTPANIAGSAADPSVGGRPNE